MKRILPFFLIIALFFATTSLQSCSRKSGCPTDGLKAKTKRNGELRTKRGGTSLFPKKMRRSEE